MALKSVFNAMKREGYIIKDLDLYLFSLNEEDNDRAIDVNAPSQIGKCLRQRFYARTQAERDSNAIDARTRRIFDNGTKTHERLQAYLAEQGMLLMDEIPVLNQYYNIQGHTDGLLAISKVEKAILEIKSINSNGFSQLKDAKEEHKQQGLSYVYCVEERRKELHELYPDFESFEADKAKLMKEYAKHYQHLKGGRKHTREEKIQFQCELHYRMDSILMNTKVPITKVIFLYENKDNQELKEYCVSSRDAKSQTVMTEVLGDCAKLNEYVLKGKVPARPYTAKSSMECRFCPYAIECWN